MFFGPIGKTTWRPWPLISWDIFDFSSETAERTSTKLDRKQDHNILYQVCVFRADRKNKMAPLAFDWLRHFRLLLWSCWTEFNETDRKQDLNILYQVCVFRADGKNKMATLAFDWLRHFRLLLWNRWTEFNETWQEASSQRPLPSLCFSGRSVNKNVRIGRFLKEVAHCTQVHDMWPFGPLVYFSSETAERNSTKLTGSKISTSSTKFVFFGRIGKTRWPPGLLLAETFWTSPLKPLNGIQQNSANRKLDLNVLYQVCVFQADQKNKMATLASDWLRLWLLLLNRWTEFNETWQEARSQRPLPSLCFSGRSEKQDGLPGLWLAETFSFSPLKLLNKIQWNLTGS